MRDGFEALGCPYDAALVTMQLAVLYLQEGGQAAKVKALAAFARAAAEERVTVELARAVAGYLERARRQPRVAFERGG